MIRGFALLLLCQLFGEALARGFGLPVPGPVLGLILLVAGLAWAKRWAKRGAKRGPKRRGRPPGSSMAADVERVSDGLLSVLALLFVPAGVGVVQHLGLIGAHGLGLGLALVGSTAITLVVTVLVFVGIARLTGAGENER